MELLPYRENLILNGESSGLKEEKTMGILNSAFELQLLPPSLWSRRCAREDKKNSLSPQVQESLSHQHFPVGEDDPQLRAQPGLSQSGIDVIHNTGVKGAGLLQIPAIPASLQLLLSLALSGDSPIFHPRR